MRRIFSSLAVFFLVGTAMATLWQVIDHLSPRNNRRPVRERTDFIILHTTEGNGIGSLSKLHKYGEANFMVDVNGAIYRLIDEDKVARHAGRSMWDKKRNLDLYSIGIEVVGYHNKKPDEGQRTALRSLLQQLQSKYNVPDERVLTHSMVAYGSPNRWFRDNHRGRKRCGMLMGTDELRASLGLRQKPSDDPDVRDGRLVVGDSFLHKLLFSNDPQEVKAAVRVYKGEHVNEISSERSAWFIARDQYDDNNTLYTYPDGRRFRGDQITDWGEIPTGTKVTFIQENKEIDSNEGTSPKFDGFKEIGIHGNTAYSIAGNMHSHPTTIYFLVDGRVRRGTQLHPTVRDHLPPGTKILMGYQYGGHVRSRERTAYSIVGKRWNYPSTYYRLPGGIIQTGDEVDPSTIPPGTLVLFER